MAAPALGASRMLGRRLGHYRLAERIGAGGMGEVYRARDEHLDRDVAIKVLPEGALADEAARKRFRKEALALSKLNHPNIATVFDFDTQASTDFLVMEYVAGVPLAECVRGTTLDEAEVLRLGMQLAEGVAAAHAHGVVHRDLKPGNIHLDVEGRLKVLDFGLARLLRGPAESDLTASLTETGAAGTLPYMAPEQLQGKAADARTDIYGIGAVLYEMATGQAPFLEPLPTVLADRILHEAPPPPGRLRPRLSPRLEDIILKCLEKDAANRYQSAADLLIDLRRLAAPRTETVAAVPRRGRRWWAAAAVFLAVVALVAGFAILRARKAQSQAAPRIQSLAVLPLANLTRDPEQDYFADGMTEALITDLSKISALKVISRTSVMHYKGSNKPLPEIARELNVDGIIEGSVLRAGDRVRITAQLIYAPTDSHLWADSYERDLRDVLALQEEVATNIAGQVQVVVTPQERRRLAARHSVNPEAYQAYLKGRYYWSQRTPESVHKGMEQFRQAIALDPGYAPPHSGLADSYIVMGGYQWMSPEEAGRLAEAEARQALALDEELAEAHTSLGGARASFNWDFATAEREYQRSLELNPGYATARQWRAEALADMGRLPEALDEARKAQELDPLSPIVNSFVGVLLTVNHQPEAAIREHRKVLEMYPEFGFGHAWLGIAYWQAGSRQEAIAEMEEARRLAGSKGRFGPALAWMLAQSGRRNDALRLVRQLESQPGYVGPDVLAIAYIGLGDKERALTLLEQGYERRAVDLPFTLRMPVFDPLRSDPRYIALMQRIGVPP